MTFEEKAKQCTAIDSNSGECATTAAGIVFKRKTYTCEKHGDIGNHTINFNLPNWVPRLYCLYCYQEMVMKNCCEVKVQE